MIDGRSITCSPFISGSKLAASNSRENKCKVILRGVTRQICIDELKDSLERQGGSIQKMFAFMPENGLTNTTNRQFLTYSVLFKDLFSSQTLINKSQLILANRRACIIVEKFNYKKSSKVNALNSKNNIKMLKYHYKPKSNRNDNQGFICIEEYLIDPVEAYQTYEFVLQQHWHSRSVQADKHEI